MQYLNTLGVDVEIIDTRRDSVVDSILQLTNGLGVDCVCWWSWLQGLCACVLSSALHVHGIE